MKKMFALLLCTLMVVGLFAGCGEKAATLEVGYGRVDISPDFSVPMTSSKYSQGVEDERLYTTCMAFRDGTGKIVLLFHNDLIGSPTDPMGFVRRDIEKKLGIPANNVMIAGTHVHYAPRVEWTSQAPIVKYNKLLRNWMFEAAEAAIADLKPAEVYTSSIETEGINFCRHYVMKDGSVAGDNFGNTKAGYKDQVREVDHEMQLVKFTREGCKDIVMVNFQTHPHRARTDGVTSDIVGAMRNSLEERTGCQFIYFTGAAGDINPYSKISGETSTGNYKDEGIAMADYAIQGAENYKKVNVGNIQLIENIYKGTPKEGVASVPDLYMYTFSIGDVAFVMAPYEMFDANGVQIKEGSPFDTTIVCTLAYGNTDYIPSYEGFEYEGVGESYEARCCGFVRGTGEILADQYISMLKQMKEAK